MKNLNIYTLLGLSLITCLISCNEDEYLEFQDTNGLSLAVLDATPSLQESAVVATYAPYRSEGMYGRYGNMLYDHVSDEFKIGITGQPTLSDIGNFLLDGTSGSSSSFYRSLYIGIAKANFVIDGSKNYTTDPEFYKPLVAEAYFMRGTYYYILATKFGEVPIKLGEETSGFQPKSPQAQVLEQAVADLTFAAAGMRTKATQSLGRATNESAFAMLGKTYLYLKQYNEAYTAFSKVTSYSLTPNYIDNFNVSGEFNDETLFEVEFQKGALGFWGNDAGNNNTMSTIRSADYSGWGNSEARPVMLEAYEDNDPRFVDTWWITGDKYGSSGRTWGVDPDEGGGGFAGPTLGGIRLKKYSSYIEDDAHSQDNGTNLRLLRFADVLLMKAEAELFRSGGSISNAIMFMNQVRSRPSVSMPLYGSAEMNAAGYPVSTTDQVFQALIHERQIELAGEGKRFLDLQRWDLDVQYLNPEKPNYSKEKRFLPLPTEQIDTNPEINN